MKQITYGKQINNNFALKYVQNHQKTNIFGGVGARFNRRGGANKLRGGGKKTRKLINGGGRLLEP